MGRRSHSQTLSLWANGDGPNQWADQEIKLAMTLLGKNKHYQVSKIEQRHFNSTARKVGYGDNAEPAPAGAYRPPEVVENVRAERPAGFSVQVADRVLGGVLTAACA